MNQKNPIQEANEKFSLGLIDEAEHLYKKSMAAYPELSYIIKFNLDYLKTKKNLPSKTSFHTFEHKKIGNFLRHIETMEIDTFSEYQEQEKEKKIKKLRIMIGTLSSGENEIELCKKSVISQVSKTNLFDHMIIENLPKKEAMDTLYKNFLSSDYDLLIKLDADMVLVDTDFVDSVANFFKHNKDISLLQCALTDYFSGQEMQGINIYTKDMIWESSSQDKLFTDKTKTPKNRRKVEWSKFSRSVIHSPNPSDFQAFHFGVHRGIKVKEAATLGDLERAEEQLVYIEKTFLHYKNRKDIRLLYAALGAEMAMHGRFLVEHLDYTNDYLEEFFKNSIIPLSEKTLREKLGILRGSDVTGQNLTSIRSTRNVSAKKFEIKTALLIIPHSGIYGGINRFLEIGRELTARGIVSVIAVKNLDRLSTGYIKMRDSFPEISVEALSNCLRREWDLAVCGDFSSGVMLSLGEVKAKITAAYLLNGWQHRQRNIQQINLVNPDIVFANSSYAESCYIELCPTLAAGAIDTNIFNPFGKVTRKSGEPLKIVVPGGRLKPRKRVQDAIEAINNMVKKGYDLELHIFNGEELEIECLARTKVWVALNRQEVSELMKSCHVVLCPEEDAGWNNPAAEAMACGIPLICTEAGTSDFAINQITAFVVPFRDVEGFTKSLEFIFLNTEESYKMADRALSKIRNFTWRSVTDQIVSSAEKCNPKKTYLADENIRKFKEKFNSLISQF